MGNFITIFNPMLIQKSGQIISIAASYIKYEKKFQTEQFFRT